MTRNLTVHEQAIQTLIDAELIKPLRCNEAGQRDDAYLSGLYDALDAVVDTEDSLQRRLPQIYEEYGVGYR